MAEDSSFDMAAQEAEAELQEIVKGMTDEMKLTMRKLVAWWKKWFMKAGHKRLGRIIANFRV
jgi:hypothetical protein